jgi:hypothetical protein
MSALRMRKDMPTRAKKAQSEAIEKFLNLAAQSNILLIYLCPVIT